MKIETYRDILNSPKEYERLIEFVRQLKRVIPLEWLDVNDWACNLCPGVYVHGRTNQFKTRRYCRCSKYDLKLAIKFYQDN
jgi:hypothetical protein